MGKLIRSIKKKLKLGNKGFTLMEMMMVMAILGVVGILSMQVLNLTLLTTRMSLNGFSMRTRMYENTSFMIREIQSADTIEVKDSGKILIIGYTDGRESIEYKIQEDEKGGFLGVDDVRAMELNIDTSKFEVEDNMVHVDLWVKNNVEGKGKKEHNYKTKILVRKQ